MEWHIITSSKGGVGKTLLTLLLTARHLELDQTPLVIDLNAMNADSGALLVEGVPQVPDPKYELSITIEHPRAAEETEQLGSENIIVQRANSFYRGKEPIPYAVGWPSNPYNLYRPSLFADFLCTIKGNLGRIQKEMGLEIKTVIIDTNYHFCNIFSQHKGYYKRYNDELKDDTITCWFLWVYRQLENLLDKKVGSDKLYKSANMIETHLKRDDNHACLMHVITPVSLISSQVVVQPQKTKEDTTERWPILSLLFTSEKKGKEQKRKQELVVEGLDKIEKVEKGNYKSFMDWITDLANAHTVLQVPSDEQKKDGKKDEDKLEGGVFLKTLIKALEDERPMNVIPLWDYHPNLQRYTDKYAKDPLANLMKYEIYESLKKLLQ
ncbi:MAG: hypothetical protein DRR19_23500 [Candidatus Parabeggiatoa sp. nov. 1]|nr:MAG: hypothetical protein DRR19_23500 [Gammaproteobacteria bacterium]